MNRRVKKMEENKVQEIEEVMQEVQEEIVESYEEV